MTAPDPRRRLAACALALVAAVALLYAPVRAHGFVPYDDDVYLTDNPHVAKGLDWTEIRWVFAHPLAANYHPLTWVSHMLDVELFGLEPGPHHLVGVALHAVNAVLVLLLGRALLGGVWAPFLAAALFALHPLRVESVAWASERKDVLCAAFFLGASLAYLGYGRAPSLGRYLAVCALFLAALLAKSMAVTFPLVALLLDVWPLGRLEPVRPWRARVPGTGPRIVLEKLPLLALAAVIALVTWYAQDAAGSASDASLLPVDLRLLNALGTYAVYLRDTLWPAGLAVFHPLAAAVSDAPRAQLLAPAGIALAVLGAGSALAWRARASRPWLLFGWCWFLGLLVPTLGLKQVGAQAHADRYTYLPLVGVAWIAAGLARALAERRPALRPAVVGLAFAVTAALAGVARAQVGVWRDGVTLFEHALAVTDDNYIAHAALGAHYLEQGDAARARAHLERSLAIYPREAATLNLLGRLELEAGDFAAAEGHLERATRLRPLPWAHYHLGRVRLAQGDPARAEREFERALELDPFLAEARFNLGQVLFDLGRTAEARAELERALADDPGADRPRVHNNLGLALLAEDDLDGALAHFELAAQAQPGFYEAELNAGLARFRRGEFALARAAFERAVAARPTSGEAHLHLGVALAKEGDGARAAAELQAALERKPALRDHPLAVQLRAELGGGSGGGR